MNRQLFQALGMGADKPEPEITPEEKSALENQLAVYAEDASSDVFKRMYESAKRIMHDAYLALRAEREMPLVFREQGVIIGLEAFFADYETAAERLVELQQRDTGQEEQDGPAPPSGDS